MIWGVTGCNPVEGGSVKAVGFGARGETSPRKKNNKDVNMKNVKRKVRINTKYDFDLEAPEKNDGQKVTETAGFIPPNVRIRQMIESGERLDEWKKDNFDYDDIGQDDGTSYDESRDMDVNDLHEAGTKALNRLRENETNAAKKQKQTAKPEEVKKPEEVNSQDLNKKAP